MWSAADLPPLLRSRHCRKTLGLGVVFRRKSGSKTPALQRAVATAQSLPPRVACAAAGRSILRMEAMKSLTVIPNCPHNRRFRLV
jgi:hypothetical protein